LAAAVHSAVTGGRSDGRVDPEGVGKPDGGHVTGAAGQLHEREHVEARPGLESTVTDADRTRSGRFDRRSNRNRFSGRL